MCPDGAGERGADVVYDVLLRVERGAPGDAELVCQGGKVGVRRRMEAEQVSDDDRTHFQRLQSGVRGIGTEGGAYALQEVGHPCIEPYGYLVELVGGE